MRTLRPLRWPKHDGERNRDRLKAAFDKDQPIIRLDVQGHSGMRATRLVRVKNVGRILFDALSDNTVPHSLSKGMRNTFLEEPTVPLLP